MLYRHYSYVYHSYNTHAYPYLPLLDTVRYGQPFHSFITEVWDCKPQIRNSVTGHFFVTGPEEDTFEQLASDDD